MRFLKEGDGVTPALNFSISKPAIGTGRTSFIASTITMAGRD
jgi:hypothetical protein